MKTQDAGLITVLAMMNIPYFLERDGKTCTAECDDPDAEVIERLYLAGKLNFNAHQTIETYKSIIAKMKSL